MVDRSSPVSETLRPEALQALKNYIQADADGVMVFVSRQALDEAIAVLSHAQRPPAITDEMLNAHIKALGNWAEPFVAERESGVAIDSDISQEDADFFNEEERKRLRLGYAAALSVSSTDRPPEAWAGGCNCLPWPDKCPYCGGDAPDSSPEGNRND